MNYTQKTIIWLLALTLPLVANGQTYKSLFDSVYSQVPKTEHLAAFDSLVATTLTTVGPDSAAVLSFGFAIKFYGKKDYGSAIRYQETGIGHLKSAGRQDALFALAQFRLGVFYRRHKDPVKSIETFQAIIDANIDSSRTARSYCQIGAVYLGMSDFYQAVTFYKKGLNLLEQLDNKAAYKFFQGEALNLCIVYSRIVDESNSGDYLQLLQKVERSDQIEPLSASRYNILHNNFAQYYRLTEAGDFAKANYHYRKLLKKANETNNGKAINAAYVNMGDLYLQQENDSALWYLKESLRYPSEPSELLKAYRALGIYYFSKKQSGQALRAINQSLAVNLETSIDSVDLMSEKEYLNCIDPDEALSGLVTKANILVGEDFQKQSEDRIALAMEAVSMADRLITAVQNQSNSNLSKLYWRRRATDVYTKGILCATRLKKEEIAFAYSEKIKALLLIEDILASTKKKELPEAVKRQELSMKKEIIEKEQLLRGADDQNTQSRYASALVNSKIAYQNFLDSLQFLYPDFYAQDTEIALADLQTVQSQLDSNSVVVSYVWDIDDVNYDHLYMFLITRDASEILLIEGAAALEELIADFRKVLTKPFATLEDRAQYRSLANNLYKRLLPDEVTRSQLKDKQVRILPDHRLHGIPFEALVTDPDAGTYLIEEAEISYAYSMSFLYHNDQIKRAPGRQLVAFAPVTFDDDELTTLKQSELEGEAIASLYDGKEIVGENASKTQFLSVSGDYEIIHLATHAQAGENPWIAFNDGKLEAAELYTASNQAELVVLSACRTSAGELAAGEGVFSLSRGFFYSGANAVVASLWNVNDKSASAIIQDFYTDLQPGESKAKALRNAKLRFLQEHDLSEASPYYWASFTLMGNTEPLPLDPGANSLNLLVICGLFFILVVLIILFRKIFKM